MLSCWRVCPARRARTAFDGDGARLYGGRWNPKGHRIVYCASSLSLATLEAFVHFDASTSPVVEQVSIRVTLDDEVIRVERVNPAKLPDDWRTYPAPVVLADIGAEWLQSKRTVALLVPSAVTPIEDNVLLNPEHPDMAKVVIGAPEPFAFDPRMYKPK